MKVSNMTSSKGNKVANQFIITDEVDHDTHTHERLVFQSYSTVIAIKCDGKIILDNNWDYSKTTGKYRNQFLSETKKETERKIKDGTYHITNLNK